MTKQHQSSNYSTFMKQCKPNVTQRPPTPADLYQRKAVPGRLRDPTNQTQIRCANTIHRLIEWLISLFQTRHYIYIYKHTDTCIYIERETYIYTCTIYIYIYRMFVPNSTLRWGSWCGWATWNSLASWPSSTCRRARLWLGPRHGENMPTTREKVMRILWGDCHVYY